MLIFKATDIENIPMATAIGLMREALSMLSARKVVVPLRSSVESTDNSGVVLFMPSYAPDWKLFGLKMVSVFPKNETPKPVIQGSLMVMSAEHGTPLATLDAAAVTALRTGAASGLATELLSLPNSTTLAIFGTGAQAWSQAAGVIAVRKIKNILVKGTSSKKEVDFCKRLSDIHKIPCSPLKSVNDLKSADVICTATTSSEPLFPLQALKEGVHVNAVGSFKPQMRELGADIIGACKLIVDQREAVLHEAGELAIPISENALLLDCIHAELGEIINRKKQGRSSGKEITVFKSVGNAIQDLAVARFLITGTA